jgi:hypothetical protein
VIVWLGEHEIHTTEFVIAANERIKIRYAFVRDTPASGLKVLDESEPERMMSNSTPCREDISSTNGLNFNSRDSHSTTPKPTVPIKF